MSKLIEPLQRSDDPEEDEVFRMNAPEDYILCTPAAYKSDQSVHERKAVAAERRRLRQQIAELPIPYNAASFGTADWLDFVRRSDILALLGPEA